MITVSLLFSVVIIPIIIATACFGLAVEETETVLKKAGHSVASHFHKKPKATVVTESQNKV
jgi:hypothetical protein